MSAVPPEGSRQERVPTGTALAMCLLTLAALGMLFLVDYVRRGFHYPVGWDAPYYVGRANEVGFDGLARIGGVRSASPLLMAMLMEATRQNAFTIVSLVPPVLAGIAGLGSAVMVRAALGIDAIWVPVIGVLTWTAFLDIGIMDGHVDNVTNVAMVLAGFGAAVIYAAWRRGAVATTLLFMAASLAEWPFYTFSVAIMLLALLLFTWPTIRSRLAGGPAAFGSAGPLAAAAAVSIVFTGLTFISLPTSGVGVAFGSPSLGPLLEARFLQRLQDWVRYVSFPLAALGAWAAAVSRVPERSRPARRLFFALMAAWAVWTVVAGVAQLFGVPVAGGRLTSYFFVPPILTAVLAWWLATGASRTLARAGRRAAGGLVAAAIGGAVLIGFGVVAWDHGTVRHPWFEEPAVREAAQAGTYLRGDAPGRNAVFLLWTSPRDNVTMGRWWYVVQASLPPSTLPRVSHVIARPGDVLSPGGTPHRRAAPFAGDPVVIVLGAYDQQGLSQLTASDTGRRIAPDVLAFNGPPPSPGVAGSPQPRANTNALSILWLGAAIVVILFVAGAGWAMALLPEDPVARAGLAPALGVATMTLAGFAWDRVGLGFRGTEALAPLVVSGAVGWAAAIVRTARARPSPTTGGGET